MNKVWPGSMLAVAVLATACSGPGSVKHSIEEVGWELVTDAHAVIVEEETPDLQIELKGDTDIPCSDDAEPETFKRVFRATWNDTRTITPETVYVATLVWNGRFRDIGYTFREDVDFQTRIKQGLEDVAIEDLMTRKRLGITVTLRVQIAAPNVSIDMSTPCLGKASSDS
ncbi:hypothetical protein [Amycolatopsis granulosa]|uniref:hypothetical protein n=1 Tax=Amycolatopsis granulosa TaxID=185684 RepID=UPI001422CF75|nr:hypothetical protein [Amycolatopsis granulosa]NIH84440.1 hypothetical protein [Amycolatopsis granulosa]